MKYNGENNRKKVVIISCSQSSTCDRETASTEKVLRYLLFKRFKQEMNKTTGSTCHLIRDV